MNYWNAGARAPQNGQTFNMNPSTINKIASQAIKNNATTLQNAVNSGKGYYNVQTTYNGITYNVVGVNFQTNTIVQVYPTKTFIFP